MVRATVRTKGLKREADRVAPSRMPARTRGVLLAAVLAACAAADVASSANAAETAATATATGAAAKPKFNDAYSPSKPKGDAVAKTGPASKGEVSDWQSRTDAAPSKSADALYPPDSPCAPIHQNIQTRIKSIRKLRADIDRSNAAPPTTVVGTLKKWMGDGYESPAAAKYTRKISEAWNAAEELNARLVAANCPPVDIEKEVAKGGTAAGDTPIEAPAEIKAQTLGKGERTIFDEPARQ